MRVPPTLLVVLAAVAVAACGGGDEGAGPIAPVAFAAPSDTPNAVAWTFAGDR